MPDTNPEIVSNEELEARFSLVEQSLQEIKNELTYIKDTMVNADSTISKVAAEVMPTINELMKSPMLKMLGMGRKS